MLVPALPLTSHHSTTHQSVLVVLLILDGRRIGVRTGHGVVAIVRVTPVVPAAFPLVPVTTAVIAVRPGTILPVTVLTALVDVAGLAGLAIMVTHVAARLGFDAVAGR